MTTTEPTPEAVEELARALHDQPDLNLPFYDALDVDCHDAARAVLAAGYMRFSELLAKLDRIKDERNAALSIIADVEELARHPLAARIDYDLMDIQAVDVELLREALNPESGS